MPRYHFDLIVAGNAEFTDADFDALFEAGCDDGTLGSCCGVASVTFTRKAESLGDAIGSAINDVEKAGFKVAKVEIEQDAAGG
jgi:hypothetical protein